MMADTLDQIPSLRTHVSHERASLKLISAVVRPERLDALKDALGALNLVGGMTISEVRGFGRQKGATARYKGIPFTPRFIEKIKIDLVITEHDLPEVMDVINRHARTGQIGDGKVFVTNVLAALRIRTGEKGEDAL